MARGIPTCAYFAKVPTTKRKTVIEDLVKRATAKFLKLARIAPSTQVLRLRVGLKLYELLDLVRHPGDADTVDAGLATRHA